jgi:sugar/nucleoside kinase (ribokinase family)
MKMYDVITFGSITIDVFLGTEAMERKGKLEYPVGTKIHIRDIDFKVGGCGINVALGLKSLGIRPALLGKYGDDHNTVIIKEKLRREKLPFLGPPGKGKTGYSIILDSVRHNRTILRYRGASDELKPQELKTSKIMSKWLYLSSSKGDTFESQKVVVDLALKKGIKIAYNPGIYECMNGRKDIRKILRATDLIILNMGEAVALSKKANPIDILVAIRRMGPKIVCITDGGKEVFCYEKGEVYRLKPHKIKIKERTGAGDAFSAGLIAGMVRETGIEYALQLGLANSESVVKYFGATNKLLSWREASQIIKKNPVKITKEIA